MRIDVHQFCECNTKLSSAYLVILLEVVGGHLSGLELQRLLAPLVCNVAVNLLPQIPGPHKMTTLQGLLEEVGCDVAVKRLSHLCPRFLQRTAPQNMRLRQALLAYGFCDVAGHLLPQIPAAHETEKLQSPRAKRGMQCSNRPAMFQQTCCPGSLHHER